MTVKKDLEGFNFNTFKHVDEKFNELKEQFIEMAQNKSDFDIEKFTVKKEGNFIAHSFHFLMRQYSLTLSEVRKLLIRKEEIERKILEMKTLLENEVSKTFIYTNEGKQEKYVDLYLKELINDLDLVEINIVSKAMSIKGFEICRLKLIELNGGNPPSNEDYQAEEPKYWKWFITKKALQQSKERLTGINEGVWNSIDYMEEKYLINPENQLEILDEKGGLNLPKFNADIELRKKLGYDYKNTIKELINKQIPNS